MENLDQIVTLANPDVVFHYAAINGTKYFYDMPLTVLQSNIDMTANLLAYLRHTEFSGKLVYASSSEVYGDPVQVPTPETHPITLRSNQPRDSYAMSKAAGEMYIKLTAESCGWDYVILRIFNCYGPRMDSSEHGQVIPEFIAKALDPGQFEIIGDG